MATLAVDTRRKFVGEVGRALRVIASDIIYMGAALGDNASGYARPLQAGDPFLGFAAEQVDNSTGSAGDKRVKRYTKGYVELAVTGVTGIGDLRKPVYASDDDTFTLTESTNTLIGKVVDFISGTTVLVAFDSEKAGIGTLAELTGSAVGTANGAMEAFTNLNNLSTATGGTANGQTELVTAPAALTDSSGGVASNTLAALTNIDALTDSTGATADNTVSDVSTAVGQASNAGSADKADVDARLLEINENFKELVDQIITQRTANTLFQTWAASIAEEVNAARTAILALMNNQEEFRTELVAQRTWNSAAANNIEEVRARLDDLVRMLE